MLSHRFRGIRFCTTPWTGRVSRTQWEWIFSSNQRLLWAMRHQLVGLYLGFALSLISCHASALKPTPVPETNMPAATIITFNGKVVHQELEGGFWG